MSEYTTAKLKAECEAAMAGRYDRVAAIKKLRELNGWSLREALDWFNREFPHLSDPPVYRNDYQRGLAEGRRQGLEEAAQFIDCGCVERAAVLEATTSAAQQLVCGRSPCAAAEAAGIRALIKEPTT